MSLRNKRPCSVLETPPNFFITDVKFQMPAAKSELHYVAIGMYPEAHHEARFWQRSFETRGFFAYQHEGDNHKADG